MAEQQGGLLSFLSSPVGQGLLGTLAGGLAGGGRTVAGNAGRGLLAGLGAFNNAQENQIQQQRAAQQGKLFDAQMQNYQTETQARQQALAQKQAQQNYLGSIGQVTSPKIGAQPNQFDPRKALSLGLSPEFISTYASADTIGKPKVARTIEGVDAQGNKVTRQFDEYGREIGGGVQAYIPPVQVDTGGRVQFVTPKPGVNLTKTMTPGEAASNSLGWANNKLGRDRLALDISQLGKPEFKDGQWVTAPRDMKPGEVRALPTTQGVKDANDALSLIKQARTILPTATGSYAGQGFDQAARFFGKSTDGAKATAQLQALEGALVSKMPKMSGPQSDKDVLLYKQMAGVIGDPTIPADQKTAALDVIEQIQTRYAQGQGGKPSASQDFRNAAPRQGAIEDGFRFLGGDASNPQNWIKVN